jgi:predicted Zn-ribbon and HTH transcriptional regulator
MAEYLVEWRIDINADNPVDAAKQARLIHQEPGSTATVFQVTDTKTNEKVDVDLDELCETEESKDSDEVVTRETCWNCGSSVAWGSGRFVNRIPSLDSGEVRREHGSPYPKGGYLCFECEKGFEKDEIRCPKCGGFADPQEDGTNKYQLGCALESECREVQQQ